MNRVIKQSKPWTPGESDMVCSKHIVDGFPIHGNAVPTLYLGYETAVKRPRRVLICELKKSPVLGNSEEGMITEKDVSDREAPTCTNCYNRNSNLLSLQEDVESLKSENKRLRQKVDALSNQLQLEKNKRKPYSYKDIKTDGRMKFYTGIQKIAIFNVIFNLIKPFLPSIVYWRGNANTVSPSKIFRHKKKRDQKVPMKDQFYYIIGLALRSCTR